LELLSSSGSPHAEKPLVIQVAPEKHRFGHPVPGDEIAAG
jgi:hypothetical protein